MKTITVHNLKESTAQEVFDFIANHLLTQNEQSVVRSDIDHPREIPMNGCLYRMEKEGRILKCAAGCLIPDEDYSPEFEGRFVWSTIVRKYFTDSDYHTTLISDLQRLHDGFPVSYWPEKLTKLALEHNLKPYEPI